MTVLENVSKHLKKNTNLYNLFKQNNNRREYFPTHLSEYLLDIKTGQRQLKKKKERKLQTSILHEIRHRNSHQNIVNLKIFYQHFLDLQTINYLSFCLSENVFILPSTLKDIFAEYKMAQGGEQSCECSQVGTCPRMYNLGVYNITQLE